MPAEEEDLDEDMDEILDKHIREVWSYYDPKGQEFLTKKQATQFFKDMLDLFALRRNMKPKDLLGPGVSLSSALTSSFQQLDKSNSNTITFTEFEEFVNMSDIEEALSLITGKTGPVEINVHAVEKVDPEAMAASAGGGKGPVQAGHIGMRCGNVWIVCLVCIYYVCVCVHAVLMSTLDASLCVYTYVRVCVHTIALLSYRGVVFFFCDVFSLLLHSFPYSLHTIHSLCFDFLLIRCCFSRIPVRNACVCVCELSTRESVCE
jgi:hypothetical protein